MKVFFGKKQVEPEEKQALVNRVFDRVARRYDLMNDISSFFLQRRWKSFFLDQLPKSLSKEDPILDLASGTGDIVRILHERGYRNLLGSDVNLNMLEAGLADGPGLTVPFICANAEQLPLADSYFLACTIAFGLRNVTSVPNVLQEVYRVLRPGGAFLCLEFSKVKWPIFDEVSRYYKHKIVPKIGQIIVGDGGPYAYLAESIDGFLEQDELKHVMQQCGFACVRYANILGGLVAVHVGYKV